LNKNKNNVNYLKKAIIFNCLNFMDIYKVLDVDLYFSQDIIDSLYEDEMDIINEEEYFKY
jgi:hypothetical protein